ncbi:hypothetical protein EVAR_62963_1 [Eumeta japonica]|uniref:Uncharacterized protein n=1 Tax=Eumeta variegata TaxID=151549 RepID=A0A4C1ZE13_EUMVA|nr:hypothetical protein EVAR_62963_1 [Eumeta japonica]
MPIVDHAKLSLQGEARDPMKAFLLKTRSALSVSSYYVRPPLYSSLHGWPSDEPCPRTPPPRRSAGRRLGTPPVNGIGGATAMKHFSSAELIMVTRKLLSSKGRTEGSFGITCTRAFIGLAPDRPSSSGRVWTTGLRLNIHVGAGPPGAAGHKNMKSPRSHKTKSTTERPAGRMTHANNKPSMRRINVYTLLFTTCSGVTLHLYRGFIAAALLCIVDGHIFNNVAYKLATGDRICLDLCRFDRLVRCPALHFNKHTDNSRQTPRCVSCRRTLGPGVEFSIGCDPRLAGTACGPWVEGEYTLSGIAQTAAVEGSRVCFYPGGAEARSESYDQREYVEVELTGAPHGPGLKTTRCCKSDHVAAPPCVLALASSDRQSIAAVVQRFRGSPAKRGPSPTPARARTPVIGCTRLYSDLGFPV